MLPAAQEQSLAHMQSQSTAYDDTVRTVHVAWREHTNYCTSMQAIFLRTCNTGKQAT